MIGKGKLIAGAVTVWAAVNYSQIAQNTFGTAKKSVAVIELKRIDDALQNYAAMVVSDGGNEFTYPPEDEFEQFMKDSFESVGRDELLDQWGKKFRYERIKHGYRLASAGKDGEFGTDDDLWLERVKEQTKMGHSLHDVEKDVTQAIEAVKEGQKEVVKAIEQAAKEAGIELPKLPTTEPSTAAPSPAPAPSESPAPAPSAPTETRFAAKAPAKAPQPPSQPQQPAASELTAAQRREVSTMLSLGRTWMGNKNYQKASACLQSVIDKFPDTPEAAAARELLGKMPP